MRRLVTVLAALTFGTLSAMDGGAAPGRSATRDRRTFAAALATIRKGMTAAQVVRILGAPDDVRTQSDPGGILTTDTSEALRYGTNGHLSCASLGQVYLNRGRAVQYVFGGRGTPPSPDLIAEPELRRLLSLLFNVGSYNGGYNYNPLAVIRAVDALHAVGRDKALATIGEYLRISSPMDDPGREGTFLVMRTLFDAAPESGGLPTMRVGAPAFDEPEDSRVTSRFPVLIEDDIPLLEVIGYNLAGLAERPESHLAWFRAHGVLRSRPLRPTDRPLETLDRLLMKCRSDRFLPTLLVNQFLALLGSVYRVQRGPDGLRFAPGTNFDSAWRALHWA